MPDAGFEPGFDAEIKEEIRQLSVKQINELIHWMHDELAVRLKRDVQLPGTTVWFRLSAGTRPVACIVHSVAEDGDIRIATEDNPTEVRWRVPLGHVARYVRLRSASDSVSL
jgi:hypothetical protein